MRAPVGGLFRHVLDLAAEQAARGYDVGIIADSTASDGLTTQRFGALEPRLKLGLKLLPMSRQPGLGDFVAARAVAHHAQTIGATVLHGHGAKGGAYARLAGRFLRRNGREVSTFYTPHGGTLNYKPGSIEGRVYLKLEKLLGRLTSGLIFESDYARRIYDARIGIGSVPARVVPNGLSPADFKPHMPDADAADVLFIGELREIKGIDVLLEALARVTETRTVRAVIVGAGPDGDALKAQAKRLGLESSVVFPGAMPAAKAFPLGRCLAVPSRAESFPYVVLEAAAAGIPLISTNVGGIPEIIGDTGLTLIPAGDVNALTAALFDMLNDPAAAKVQAMRLNTRVGELFTVAAMTTAILDFYRNPAKC
jgi:glycosyltransferase involved in cell wall biosynthesis